jgi:hypothetical protein
MKPIQLFGVVLAGFAMLSVLPRGFAGAVGAPPQLPSGGLPPPSTTTVTVNGTPTNPPITGGGKVFSSGGTVTTTTPPGKVVVTGTGNTDPNAHFVLDVVNNDTGSDLTTYRIDFVMPFTNSGISLLHTLEADLSATLGGAAPYFSPFIDSVDPNTDLLMTFLLEVPRDTAPDFSPNSAQWVDVPLLNLGDSNFVSSLNPSSDPQGFAPVPNFNGFIDGVDLRFQFQLGGSSDLHVDANFNAPEPTSLFCWSCLGFVFAGALAWRRCFGRNTTLSAA